MQAMAGVESAYQYSVEVKSRFSLFMDDEINNEDPDILISKLQKERATKLKKEKSSTEHPAPQETKKTESVKDGDVKQEQPTMKAKPVRMPRLPKTTQPTPPAVVAREEETHTQMTIKEAEEVHAPPMRGRGGPRGFPRGYRGRGQGPRNLHVENNDNVDEANTPRDSNFEHRGRGRGRPRGFGRGRGQMYTDYRAFDRQPGAERMATKLTNKQEGEEINDNSLPDGDNQLHESSAEHITENGKDENRTENEGTMEEEPKHYTLEEYRAMQSSLKPTIALSTKGSRKANDGKDVFANMVAHQKFNEVSDEEVEEEVEKQPEEEQPFDIDVKFTDSYSERSRGRGFGARGFDRGRGMGARGGRPVERGFRGRGGARGEGRGRGFNRGMATGHRAAPAINSDQDFPSLK